MTRHYPDEPFPYDLLTAEDRQQMDLDEHCPHGVMDGKWACWTRPRWFKGKEGFPPRDVFEFEWIGGRWLRVWDDAAQRWRGLTRDEYDILMLRDQWFEHVMRSAEDILRA